MKRWVNRPPGSNWGEFGENDQIGRLNLIGTEQVRKGVAEVKEGLTFCLSLPLDYPGGSVLAPHRFAPQISPTKRNGQPFFNYSFENDGPCYCGVGSDDTVLLSTQYSTQWDSLAHIGHSFDANGDGKPELVYYNGYRAGDDVIEPARRSISGKQTALGVEHMAVAGIQGRAVMLDLHGQFGRERKFVGYDDLMRTLETDRIELERGDILCLHTGFADLVLEMQRHPDPHLLKTSCPVLDGCDEALLNWITDSGVSAIAADNYAVEGLPARQRQGVHAFAPLHVHCLFKLGVPLGELWHLGPLNAWLKSAGRSRFLLTAPPLRLPGAVGSPVTPIGTV